MPLNAESVTDSFLGIFTNSSIMVWFSTLLIVLFCRAAAGKIAMVPAAKAEDAVAKKTTTAAGNIRRRPCIGIRPDTGTRERSIYELDLIQVEFVKNFTKSIFARGYKDSG